MPVTGEDTLDRRFAARMGALLGPEFPPAIGLAVSGGADSMAMLALAHGWARQMGVRLHVATVDHGLRPENAAEARAVAAECRALGHSHDILGWQWDGQGNLQDAARRARLDLIGWWRGALGHVLFAHSLDDQAETVLLRLERGSGVDGLSAMSEARDVPSPGAPPPEGLPRLPGSVSASGRSWRLLRPLLAERRAALRHHAETLHLPFADDPSNANDAFARVRARKAIAALGLDAEGLARTAGRMARARAALEARTDDVARGIAREGVALGLPTGIADIARDGFARIERETQLRLMARAVGWVTGAIYRPRASALEDALDRALGGAGSTLAGAQVIVGRSHIHVLREAAAVADCRAVPGSDPWDGRWHLAGAVAGGQRIRALGADGWAQIPEKPEGAPPHALALSLPAVFDGAQLVAAPHFAFGPRLEVALRAPTGRFVNPAVPH